MNKTMLEVWSEAVSDYDSLSLHGKDYEAYMYKGIKIINTDQEIKIYYGNLKAIGYIEVGSMRPLEYLGIGSLLIRLCKITIEGR
jgi:hypothetical protein